jgi:polysaccharide biosynthesis protein PslH
MKILFVTPYIPSNVRIRPLALIRELARLGHQVTLVCLAQPAWERNYIDQVKPYCQAIHSINPGRIEPYWRTLLSLPTNVPMSVAYCHSSLLDQTVRKLTSHKEFDLIHTEFVRAIPATIHLENYPKIFDAVDSMTLAYHRSISAPLVPISKKIIFYIEWLKMRSYEAKSLRGFDKVLISSPADKEELESTSNSIEVLANGVDLNYFAYSEVEREPSTIVFLGKMSYYVNVASVLWFYREVFPLLRKRQPDIKWKIVGRNPVKKIFALNDDPAIEVTGTVEDVRPYLAKSTVAICPMVCGAGIQNKMLEAMAIGTPCVATSVACQALQAEHGEHLLIADQPEEFASAIEGLLIDKINRRRMSTAARQYVQNFHNWEKIGNQLEEIYRTIL